MPHSEHDGLARDRGGGPPRYTDRMLRILTAFLGMAIVWYGCWVVYTSGPIIKNWTNNQFDYTKVWGVLIVVVGIVVVGVALFWQTNHKDK